MLGLSNNLSFFALFLEGLLSAFSPCVLPIIPLYLGYLGQEDSSTPKSKRLLKMVFFIIGISLTFVILSFGTSLLSNVFQKNSALFKFLGGIVLILFALVALNIIAIPVLDKLNLKDKFKPNSNLSYLQSLLLGFCFSFGFTPCVGPMLAQATLLAAQADSQTTGRLYILAYFLGFILIFVLLGVFTSAILDFIKKHKNVVKYTSVIAGILILVSGIYMSYQGYNQLTKYSSTPQTVDTNQGSSEQQTTETPSLGELDFYVEDLDGNQITSSELDNGKPTVLYFAQTWCTYCSQETPILEQIKSEYGDKINIYLIDNMTGENGLSKEAITDAFALEHMNLYFDTTGLSNRVFGVTGYPTSYFFDSNGEILGYVPGYLPEDQLRSVIESLLS